MKSFLKTIIVVINIIACFFVVILGAIGFIADIIGPTIYEKITKILDVSWTFKQSWIFSMIWFLIFLVTSVILKLLFKKEQ